MTMLKIAVKKLNLNKSSFYFRMAKHLNVNCDYNSGFLVCDILRDVFQIVLKIKTPLGKHSLTEDCDKRTEKYQP